MITVTECSFCYAFWSTLFAVLLNGLPLALIPTVPVIVMFLDMGYQRLRYPTFTITQTIS
jgi:hypothetical protein